MFVRPDHAIMFGAILYVVAKRQLREDTSTRMLALFLIAACLSICIAYGIRGREGFASGVLHSAPGLLGCTH